MGAIVGQANTTNVKNYLGELFFLTPSVTKFLSMIGDVSGGVKAIGSTEWSWQDTDNPTPSQDTKLEGADATFSARSRSVRSNVLQIHQEAFELSYTTQAARGNLAADNLDITGVQPVQDERAIQAKLKLEKIRRDVNFSFLQGVYANPADPTVAARQTRGIYNAVTTNVVDAGLLDLTKEHIDTLLRTMVDNGAVLFNPVFFAGSFNRQQVSSIYGYAPESRTVGGVRIEQVETDFATLGITYERDNPTNEVGVLDLSLVKPVALPIPGKGVFFAEPLAKTGSAEKWQYYGEIGIEYGIEEWHGKVTNLTTA